jgi:hypothetical protein
MTARRWRSAVRWTAPIALVVSASLLAAPAASARFSARKAIWGPDARHGHSLWPTYHRLGIGIYETALDWSVVAPERPRHPDDPNGRGVIVPRRPHHPHHPRGRRPPHHRRRPAPRAYDWPPSLTRTIARAKRYHVQIAIQLWRAPRWASGHRETRWAPRHASDFAAFATAAARRYPSVHLWMIWGEPNRRGDFKPLAAAKPGTRLTARQARGPHIYAGLLAAAYHALKRVNPRNLVIGGMTFTGGTIDTEQWIENLKLPDGRTPPLDMYGHNPFGYRRPDLSDPPSPDGEVDLSDLGRLSALVDRVLGHGRRVPLFLSEYTIPTHRNAEFPYWVDPQLQASWLSSAFAVVHALPQVYALGWIHLFDKPPIFGGLEYAGGRPKPAFSVFAAAHP